MMTLFMPVAAIPRSFEVTWLPSMRLRSPEVWIPGPIFSSAAQFRTMLALPTRNPPNTEDEPFLEARMFSSVLPRARATFTPHEPQPRTVPFLIQMFVRKPDKEIPLPTPLAKVKPIKSTVTWLALMVIPEPPAASRLVVKEYEP